MKKSLSRIVSVLLLLSMVLGFLPQAGNRVHAVTQNQQNIVDRANYLYDLTWVAQETISGWRYQYTFEKGGTYRLPYAQPIYAGYYIGYGVTIEDFLAAAADGTSVFYTEMSTYNGWDSTYYGTDCSAYVSWCWGATRHTTYSIPQISTSYGMATESNIRSYLQLGDALNSNSAGHVVLVTDITYDTTGTMTQIEITEQTPPQLKRSYYTPAELAEKYQAQYDICRYNSTVPAAPEVSYVSRCTSYAAHCVVEVTRESAIMSLPCDTSVEGKSAQLGTVAAGDTITATGLYENTLGQLWYRFTTEDGQTGYLLAEATVYQAQITDDITVTDADSPNAHVQGDIFYVTGTISARYNQLTTAAVYIHQGFGRDGAQVTGSSDTVTGNSYTLKGSDIDNDTAFDSVGTGAHTYVISAQYQNYYVAEGVIQSNTGTKYLLEDYFVCVTAAADQDSCAHSYSDTTMAEADCVTDGAVVHACLACGYVYEETIAAAGHSFGDWEVVTAAGCDTEGAQERSCTACGEVEEQRVPAAGHDYTATAVDSTCIDYSHTENLCGTCGHSYKVYDTMSDWSDTLPEGVEQADTKQQYRYRNYETVTSREETLDGWEQLGSAWVADAQGEVIYVPSWPSGFDTNSSIYAEYDNAASKVTAYEDDTGKLTVESDARAGYLYYHWCSASDANHYSYAQKSSTHTIFHAYYSETAPSNYKCDTSDMSYQTADSCCENGNSQWFFVTDVYAQRYTTYAKEYTYGGWGDWSDWSDEPVEASETCQVESRILYSWPVGEYGDHSFMDGICTLCGEVQEASYYLFGWIDGRNYGCEENADELGAYSFAGGKLTATFASDCYVGVKTADNAIWYMTEGWQGEVTSVTLYPTELLESADKLYVPGGMQITFTLTQNDDGTLTLSYETAPCPHESHAADGSCTKCGQAVDHSYEAVTADPTCTTDGTVTHTCTVCGDSYIETLAASGHSYETVTVAPTCTAGGTATHTCTVCGDSYTETLAASGHSHETVTVAPTCTAGGTATHTCTVCGDSYTETLAATGHSYETVTVAPTCTAGGTVTQTCTACGDTVTQTLAASGHDYTATAVDSTCIDYSHTEYICGTCGHSYKVYDTMSDWSDTLPEGVEQADTKQQYRYRDYETVTSREEALEGWEQLGSAWVADAQGEVVYVPSWPGGFDTTSSIYTQYDNAASKVTAYEDDTGKLTVESDAQVGYLYYHWCRSGSNLSTESAGGSYTTFHAFYSTTTPPMDQGYYDSSDDSHKMTEETVCGNSPWYFVTDVYAQKYTTYVKEYIYGSWGQWSDWSDEEVAASDTRQVEERTVYRYPTGELGDHQWSGTVCRLCGQTRELEYCLFGWINGANYACEEDYENVGQYRFVDGTLTATFTEDSYVAVKTTDNAIWYMSEGYIEGAQVARLYDTASGLAYPEKLKVPGGVEVTFTLVENEDGSLTLSYETAECPHQYTAQITTAADCTTDGITTYSCSLCGNSYTETIPATGHSYSGGSCTVCGGADPDYVADPGLTLKYPSLSFEDEIFYNVYFTVGDTSSVEEFGLMLLSSYDAGATMDDAIGTVPGFVTNGTMYMVRSQGIAAAYMGDTVYFKVYAKLTDGSYAYSSAGGYNAKAYASTVLGGDYTSEMKSLVVAMANYGAEAQLYFGHNTDALVNASLTDDQKALVAAYDESMVDAVVPADSSKTANFVRVSSNFSSLYPSVSFDSAFSINFYCTPTITVDDGMTLYYWDAEDYASISEFSVDNATGSMEMTLGTTGQYWGQVPGIAAKNMDKTYYVSCVFESEGETVTTGIIAYSLGKYCEGKAATDGDAQQTFAQATAVYGYYAKQYFASIA